MEIRSENELDGEESLFLPTVEYLQYLIARTQPAADGVAPTEEEWTEALGPGAQGDAPDPNTSPHWGAAKNAPREIDMLRFMIDSQRLAVRVNQDASDQPCQPPIIRGRSVRRRTFGR